ncbi:MAG: YveK family protein [Vagococcus sp.]
MEETVSLQEIFSLLKNKMVLIATTMFLGIGISAVLTYMVITPKYTASTQMIATFQSKDNVVNTDNINTNLLMINTYKDFIKGNVVTETAHKALQDSDGFKGTQEDIKNMINVEQNQNSQMFSITATSSVATEAANVSNKVAEIFRDQAGNYTDADKIAIISPAEVPTKPVSPNKKINLAIGAVLGVIVGVGLAFVGELFNKQVHSEDYIKEKLGLPILGVIPVMTDKELAQTLNDQETALAEGSFWIEETSSFNMDDDYDGLDRENYTGIFEERITQDDIDDLPDERVSRHTYRKFK